MSNELRMELYPLDENNLLISCNETAMVVDRNLKARFTFDVSDTIVSPQSYNTLARNGNIVYVQDGKTYVHALDLAAGKKLFTSERNRYYGHIAHHENLLLVTGKVIKAFDDRTGNKLWETKESEPSFTVGIADGKPIQYTFAYEGKATIGGIDLKDGTTTWTASLPGDFAGLQKPLEIFDRNGRLYVRDENGLAELDINDRKIRRRWWYRGADFVQIMEMFIDADLIAARHFFGLLIGRPGEKGMDTFVKDNIADVLDLKNGNYVFTQIRRDNPGCSVMQ
jgi:outer membrane protein assembly factor BamB